MTALDQAFIKAYTYHDDPLESEERSQPPAIDPPAAPEANVAEECSMSQTSTIYRPSLEVDHFIWPSACKELSETARDQVERLASAVAAGLSQGTKVVAFCGCRQGDGCTTVLLSVARRLAAAGVRTLLVDADFEQPMLARRLGLLPEAGWEDALFGRLPVEEAVIESVEDRLCLLPLRKSQPHADPRGSLERDPAADIAVLREHYDLVLIDLGRFTPATESADRALRSARRWIDAAVVVNDARNAPSESNPLCQRLRDAGIAEAGVVENFV